MLDNHASNYPPGPALMLSKFVDVLCNTFQCQQWRDHVPFGWAQEPSGWLSHRVGTVTENFPAMVSYRDFLDSHQIQHSSFMSLYKYAFETPSTDLSLLTTRSAALVLIVLVLLFRYTKQILLPFFSGIGRRAGRKTHGVEWERRNEVRIVKFGEYVFRLLYHSVISIYGVWYFWDSEWWRPGGTSALWVNYPFHQVTVGMTWYYLVQSAYNLEALLSLAELSFSLRFSKSSILKIGWSKTVRGDFREMAVHHIVTNLLVIGSSFFRFTRIGSMVFLVHDISDIPVDVSKLANFLKYKTATIVGFVSMVLMWLVCRLTILPFVIYRSILTESWVLVYVADPVYYYCYRYFFYGLVGQIILLHLAWFVMFLRMGWLLVQKGETHDLSEHKKGEDQHHVENGLSSNSNGTTNGHCNGVANGVANGFTNGHHATNGSSKSKHT